MAQQSILKSCLVGMVSVLVVVFGFATYHMRSSERILGNHASSEVLEKSRHIRDMFLSVLSNDCSEEAGSAQGDFASLNTAASWPSVRGQLENWEKQLVRRKGSAGEEPLLNAEIRLVRFAGELTLILQYSWSYDADLLDLLLRPPSDATTRVDALSEGAGANTKLRVVRSAEGREGLPVLMQLACSPVFGRAVDKRLAPASSGRRSPVMPVCSGQLVLPVAAGGFRDVPEQDWNLLALSAGMLDETGDIPTLLRCPSSTHAEVVEALFEGAEQVVLGDILAQQASGQTLSSSIKVALSGVLESGFVGDVASTVGMVCLLLLSALALAVYVGLAGLFIGDQSVALWRRTGLFAVSRLLLPAVFSLPPFAVAFIVLLTSGRNAASLDPMVRTLLSLACCLVANMAAFDLGNFVSTALAEQQRKPHTSFLASLGVGLSGKGRLDRAFPALLGTVRFLWGLGASLLPLPLALKVQPAGAWPGSLFLLRAIQQGLLAYSKQRMVVVVDAFVVVQLLFESQGGLFGRLTSELAQAARSGDTLTGGEFDGIVGAGTRFLVGLVLCSGLVRVFGTALQSRARRIA